MELLKRIARSRPTMISAVFVGVAALLAALAPMLTPYDPLVGSGLPALQPPFTEGHVLGTDHLGRDMLSRLLHGGRVSLSVGFFVAITAVTLGVLFGAAAGFFGGRVDSSLMAIAEVFQTLPRLVLAVVVIAIFGSGYWNTVFVIAILSWPQTARVVRAGFLSTREALYVDAARIAGMPRYRIILSEIMPNIWPSVVVIGSLEIATAILLEAALGFFGLGDPSQVSWGTMLNAAQSYLRQAWWMATFPGIAITLSVFAINIVGDGLTDALNPRFVSQRRRGWRDGQGLRRPIEG